MIIMTIKNKPMKKMSMNLMRKLRKKLKKFKIRLIPMGMGTTTTLMHSLTNQHNGRIRMEMGMEITPRVLIQICAEIAQQSQ